MKYILTIIIIFITISCGTNNKESYEELSIMNTLCIDGKLHFSIVDHGVCFYTPVSIEGEHVRCGE